MRYALAALAFSGGADGARTRDLRRDRPVPDSALEDPLCGANTYEEGSSVSNGGLGGVTDKTNAPANPQKGPEVDSEDDEIAPGFE